MTANVVYLGGLRTEATHTRSGSIILTDAPVDNEGKGELFSPTDLMATSLASCMLTVMGIRARKGNIPFANVQCEVTKIMKSNPRRLGKIMVNVIVSEEWNERQKAVMEQTGKDCPVALSLHPDVEQELNFVYSLG